MKPRRFIFGLALLLIFNVGTILSAQAQLSPFPGSKVLDSGPNPVGLGKASQSTFLFTIHLNSGFDNTNDVLDVAPAEFDVAGGLCSQGNVDASCSADVDCDTAVGAGDGICAVNTSLSPSCGTAMAFEKNKPGDKLRPDRIVWDLDGCNSANSQSLVVSLQTDQNPGHGKRSIAFFEPTSCGPLFLNDGARLIDPVTGDDVSEPSNALFVASCPVEGDSDCVDGDGDGWSVACGDTVDNDATVFPGAPEICGDGKDNNLDGQIDEGCVV